MQSRDPWQWALGKGEGLIDRCGIIGCPTLPISASKLVSLVGLPARPGRSVRIGALPTLSTKTKVLQGRSASGTRVDGRCNIGRAPLTAFIDFLEREPEKQGQTE